MPHFFITTAIDYTNAPPHIGHAYEKVLADVLARYHRLKGDDVFFLTGVDQHGQKVQQSAEKQGVAPQQFVDRVTQKFIALWDKLDVRYDRWAATTDPAHKDCVRALLDRLNREGQIYKAKRAGYYSVRQEQFLTDKERNDAGEFGPEWGQVEFREEENYYFRLAEHRAWLLGAIESGKLKVAPEFRVAELRNAVEKLEGDLCISRPRARLSWGIPFPFDEEYVTYVWFDALVNYISFAPGFDASSSSSSSSLPRQREGGGEGEEEGEFRRWWPALHVIGKDIMIPAHGVYWPVMLKALGFTADDVPALLVHGWWNVRSKTGESEKMSKSLGNVVDPNLLADKYGAEALRYYLMSDIATGRDADFSEERLVQRYNSDLANNLGNLLNRTLNMAQKYRAGKLARHTGGGLSARAGECVAAHAASFEGFSPDAALNHVQALATEANQFIEQRTPWKLAKDPAQAAELDAVLYDLAEALRIIAILLSPVLPRAAAGIFAQLQWDRPFALADAQWGALPDGHVLGQPTPLFPRIEAATP